MASSTEAPPPHLSRPSVPYSSLPDLAKPFYIDPSTRSYRHQYANIYFVRLVELRNIVEKAAAERWAGVRGQPPLLPRILNVQRSQLCYIVGTVYMDMPLKPNVLEDMARDHWIAPPAPRPKFYSAQDAVHLEDESGRVRLVGDVIKRERNREGGGLVTGVIMAVLGMETSAGDFEVVDICFAGLPDIVKPPSAADVVGANGTGPLANGKGKGKGKAEAAAAATVAAGDVDMDGPVSKPEDVEPGDKTWVAIVSGLSIGSEDAPADVKTQMLVEWLSGESGGMEDHLDGSRIARLVLAGNSLTSPVKGEDDRQIKRFNSSSKPLFSSHPTKSLAAVLTDLIAGSSLPITVVPGPSDPAGGTLPQQPLPKVMLGGKREGLECISNPGWMGVGNRSFLVTGGQTIDDIYKYLPSSSRLAMARRTLEWRHIAPTAPDTLWIYPFPDQDPFIIHHRPDIYVVGNQPDFETASVGDPDHPTRIILVPSFATTGIVPLVCLETLEVRTIGFEAPVWEGDEEGEGEGTAS